MFHAPNRHRVAGIDHPGGTSEPRVRNLHFPIRLNRSWQWQVAKREKEGERKREEKRGKERKRDGTREKERQTLNERDGEKERGKRYFAHLPVPSWRYN